MREWHEPNYFSNKLIQFRGYQQNCHEIKKENLNISSCNLKSVHYLAMGGAWTTDFAAVDAAAEPKTARPGSSLEAVVAHLGGHCPRRRIRGRRRRHLRRLHGLPLLPPCLHGFSFLLTIRVHHEHHHRTWKCSGRERVQSIQWSASFGYFHPPYDFGERANSIPKRWP